MDNSASSSSRSASPEITVSANRKRKQKEDVTVETDLDSSATSESEAEGEPVISHAERRRRKREEKRAEKLKEAGGDPQKKRKLRDGTAKTIEATTKRQNSVWVGNLSYKTQYDSLRTFFKAAGEITRIHMPTRTFTRPGMKSENRGFAYVDFETPEAKAAAIALSEQPLLGRKLLIKDGDNFEGRPAAVTDGNDMTVPPVSQRTHSKTAQKILGAQKQLAAPTLFLGNLPFETTENEIWQLLDAHRPRDKKGKGTEAVEEKSEDWIRKIRMGTFEDSGLCKGFAFVDFTSIANAAAALINPKNHHLNGRTLVVEYASPDAVRRGASKAAQVRRVEDKRRVVDYAENRGLKKADGEAEETGTELTAVQHEKPPHLEDNSKTGKTSFSQGNTRNKAPDVWKQKPLFSRPKPGAALAKAKRETVAIVPSQGKKTVF